MNKQEQFIKACRYGDLATVKRLMNDPDVVLLDRGNYAIRWASQYRHLDIVKLLLNHPKIGFKDMNSPIVKQLELDCEDLGGNFELIKEMMLEIVKGCEAEAERERIRKRDAHIWDTSVLF